MWSKPSEFNSSVSVASFSQDPEPGLSTSGIVLDGPVRPPAAIPDRSEGPAPPRTVIMSAQRGAEAPDEPSRARFSVRRIREAQGEQRADGRAQRPTGSQASGSLEQRRLGERLDDGPRAVGAFGAAYHVIGPRDGRDAGQSTHSATVIWWWSVSRERSGLDHPSSRDWKDHP